MPEVLSNDKEESTELVTMQPEKIEIISQPRQLKDEVADMDCVTWVTLCCNGIAECWLGMFACVTACCDAACCMECLDGAAEGCAECLKGCGECCISCVS